MIPPLREDLALSPGPFLPDGQPSWTLYDPARNLFFRIDWTTFEVLRRWDMGDEKALASDVSSTTTLQLEPDDVREVLRFLGGNQLTQNMGPDSPRLLAERLARIRGSAFDWLLHHYLFFRIPLLRPNEWLGRWVGVAALFFSPAFLGCTLAALLLGFFLAGRQWDQFSAQLVDHFSAAGAASYAAAIVVVKGLHELGHAFTAKRLGCRVPTMGVAFLVLLPMAYTDTNDAWRLNNSRDRLLVASAGIMTELIVAAWALLAWSFLPEGVARSSAFVLATTSIVATLAVNASPFMRFDGYFILTDVLDMPNLHDRCFALARWRLREMLFDLGEEPPEIVSPRARRWMIVFGWLTWAYRLSLFLGIAVLVYQTSFKLLGIFLFAVEITWFVWRPLRTELKSWWERRSMVLRRRRSLFSALLFVALIGAAFVPWQGHVVVSGILRPAESWPAYAPAGARLDELNYGEGDLVREGAVIAALYAPDLSARGRALVARLEQLQSQAASSSFDEQTRARLLVIQEMVASAKADLASARAELQGYTLKAPFTGRLRDLDPDLAPGQWLTRKERIALLVREETPWVVETWLDEEAIQRVRPGAKGLFIIDSGAGPGLVAAVEAMDRDASRVLPRGELAAHAGGHVLVREKGGQLIPESAIYRVTLSIVGGAAALEGQARQSWRGHLAINASAEAPGLRFARQAWAVLVREFGF